MLKLLIIDIKKPQKFLVMTCDMVPRETFNHLQVITVGICLFLYNRIIQDIYSVCLIVQMSLHSDSRAQSQKVSHGLPATERKHVL